MSLRYTLVKQAQVVLLALTVSPVIPGHRLSTPTLSIQGMSISNYLRYSGSAFPLFSSGGHVSFFPPASVFRHSE